MMARRRSKVLNDKQKKVLEVLERYQKDTGYPPSIREICDEAGISSTSVANYYLDQLKELGYIERVGRVSRGIRLLRTLSGVAPTDAPLAAPKPVPSKAPVVDIRQAAQNVRQAIEGMLRIPIVGQIVAGEPMPVPSSDFSYFDPESLVDVAASMLPPKERSSSELFALHVKGDSMIDAMVNDGDIVIMKPAQTANNGEMVAVWLTDREETTLKYYYLEEKGRVRLQPANPTMEPIYIEDPNTVQIQGKVIMVIRQVGGPL